MTLNIYQKKKKKKTKKKQNLNYFVFPVQIFGNQCHKCELKLNK